jgi:hypothetical protein
VHAPDAPRPAVLATAPRHAMPTRLGVEPAPAIGLPLHTTRLSGASRHVTTDARDDLTRRARAGTIVTARICRRPSLADRAKDWASREGRPPKAGKNRQIVAERAGFESETPVLTTRTHVDSREEELTRTDASAQATVDVGPTGESAPEANVSDRSVRGPRVEELLAVALERASAAGEWAVVALLARELEARRGAAGSSK